MLDRNPSTISRELKRNSYKKSIIYSVTGYSPLQANNKNRRLNCHRKVNFNNDILRRKENFKRPAETRGKFNIGKTIKKRPKEVFGRNAFGHQEADTVVSGRIDGKAKSSYCFVTLAERKSRLYVCKHISDRKEETVTKAIIELLSKFPKELVKTITCNR